MTDTQSMTDITPASPDNEKNLDDELNRQGTDLNPPYNGGSTGDSGLYQQLRLDYMFDTFVMSITSISAKTVGSLIISLFAFAFGWWLWMPALGSIASIGAIILAGKALAETNKDSFSGRGAAVAAIVCGCFSFLWSGSVLLLSNATV